MVTKESEPQEGPLIVPLNKPFRPFAKERLIRGFIEQVQSRGWASTVTLTFPNGISIPFEFRAFYYGREDTKRHVFGTLFPPSEEEIVIPGKWPFTNRSINFKENKLLVEAECWESIVKKIGLKDLEHDEMIQRLHLRLNDWEAVPAPDSLNGGAIWFHEFYKPYGQPPRPYKVPQTDGVHTGALLFLPERKKKIQSIKAQFVLAK